MGSRRDGVNGTTARQCLFIDFQFRIVTLKSFDTAQDRLSEDCVELGRVKACNYYLCLPILLESFVRHEYSSSANGTQL